MKVLTVLCLLAILVNMACAHHSLRVRKPETEDEKIEHHLHHRRQPRKELRNNVDPQGPDTRPKIRRSPSYHFKVGPEYPDHSKTRHDYKRPARRDHRGDMIPEEIPDSELHRFMN